MPINQSILRQKAYSYSSAIAETQGKASIASELGQNTAFLCHSHKDVELVKGLIVLFKELGIRLYIDWQDRTMPEKPNSETAKKIQGHISQCAIFLFLATANSKASRWCPWEIGFADSSQKKIYIIPTVDGVNSYGNEYLDLYAKIDVGNFRIDNRHGYFVYQPNAPFGYAVSDDQLLNPWSI